MSRIRRERLRPAVFGAIALVVSAVGIGLLAGDPMHQLERKSIDARFTIRGKQQPRHDLVVVAFDDNDIAQVSQRLHVQYPFPRQVHADLLNNVMRDGPRAVAFDIQFSEHSQHGVGDDAGFIQALMDANRRAVLSTTTLVGGRVPLFGSPLITPQVLNTPVGYGSFPTDSDGVVRHMPYAVDRLRSLGVTVAEVVSGRRIAAPAHNSAWIDFYGPPGTIPQVSFARVWSGRMPAGFFRNKIVIVGSTAPTLQDFHQTPVGQNMAGAELQADATATALRNFPLRDANGVWNVVLIAVMGFAAPLASIRLSLVAMLVIALAEAFALALGVQVAFDRGSVVAFVYPATTLLLATVASLGGHYVLRAFEQVRVTDLFSRFVPADVVGEVLKRTDDDLRLGGVRRQGTVMFTDLRGFTSFSERLEPERVVEVINHYLSEMSEAILDHGGTLVSYMGDGIMALFGAPLEQPDHADRALAASAEMLAERLPRFNAWMAAQGFDHAFRMGIGLNSGAVMSGNVGSARRLEYTAIGDTTNTASRLEGMTKGTPHQLFIADSTRQALREAREDLIYVDELPVRGREEPLKVWSLAERQPPAAQAPVA